MKYLVLVSHGQFADGLKDALSMLAGERDDVLSAGLKNGKSADEFAEEFSHVIEGIHQDDEIILLGDLYYHGPRNPLTEEYAPKDVADILNSHKDKILAVRGNCDAEVDQMISEFKLEENLRLEIGGKKFFFK